MRDGAVVVLGTSRPLGRSVVETLSRDGEHVRAVEFSPGGPEGAVEADPGQAGTVAAACSGASFIYDCYEPSDVDWKGRWKEVASRAASSAIESGATLVLASHLTSSEVDNAATEKEVLAAHNSGLARTVVARLPQLYGRGEVNPLFREIFDSVLAGRKAHWVGNPDVRRSYTDVEDAAKAMLHLGRTATFHGRAWNVACPFPLTGREFIEFAFRAVGKEPKVGNWGRGVILTGSILDRGSREILGMPYSLYERFVLDGKQFADALPTFSFTPPEKTVSASLERYAEGIGIRMQSP
jgi:NAD dependent epimerase/dehydratase family